MKACTYPEGAKRLPVHPADHASLPHHGAVPLTFTLPIGELKFTHPHSPTECFTSSDSLLSNNIMGSFTSLAEEILVSARRLDEHLASNNLPSASFDQDTLVDLPNDVEAARDNLVNTTQTLKQLAQGGVGRAMEIAFSWTGLLSLHAIYSFKIANAVPLTGSTTYSAIATQTSIPESLVRRFLRPAMSSHIFTSPTYDTVAHTASSRLFITLPDFHEGIGLQADELAPVAAKTVDAVRTFNDSGEPYETAFALQNEMPIFEVLGKYPERGRRFGAAMRCYTKGEGYDLRHLVEGYDWRSIDHPGAVVVDVGGGHGSVSQALARATKDIQYVVQDLQGTIEQAKKELPADEFAGRIEFKEHDFFTEQSVKEADVYLMRWILHDWSDGYCVKILKRLVPALEGKRESRIVLFEYVLPEVPETRLTERMGTNLDMIMLSVFNGAERTKREFEHLLEAAHPRLRMTKVVKPEGSAMSIIEVALEG
ncbi:MAG: hypothetical protein L6R38_005497 [Xanthoria sp. 2 TBL-2021]|nr:MAG: hypothetical protein L6R38_005497 [Xanthoria sp. 2 TBL-2021]